MKITKILFCCLLIQSGSSFATNSPTAGSYPLFPEDGSQKITKWYYSEKELPYLYQNNEWDEVLEAFEKEDITPINTKIGSFFQDLGFFDTKGNLLVQHFPLNYQNDDNRYEAYFKGFTQEIFVQVEYGQAPIVNFLSSEDLKAFDVQSRTLKDTFIEGGASISGKFANGEDYLLVNHSAYLGLKTYFQDRYGEKITEQEIKKKIESDLNLKTGNFIVLVGTSHIHLDTFMKALPNGNLIIDAPAEKIALLEKLYRETQNPEILNYLDVEKSKTNFFYRNAIKKTKKILAKRFKIKDIPGVFSRKIKMNGSFWETKDINFFNGVSGKNNSGDSFFITNAAVDVSELEDFWQKNLESYGFLKNHVHFVGRYKGNAGLDCMGSPSP
jgi:hypothetical protein